MSRRNVARGQPLIALSVILMSWVTARALIVEATPPTPEPEIAATAHAPAPVALTRPAFPLPAERPAKAALEPGRSDPPTFAPPAQEFFAPVVPEPQWAAPPRDLPALVPDPPQPAPLEPREPVSVKVAAGHQLLWMAALAHLPMPADLTAPQTPRAPPAAPAPTSQIASRWSGDAWVLYRRDSASLSQGGFFPATYGASQAGAVLRYRLDRTSAHRFTLYLRASSALRAPLGEEAALGLSLRPLSQVPIAALAEVRATHFAGGTHLRPAAMLVTELPAFDLPAGLRGETYVQAGYVGGEGATAFVDGQLRADRRVVSIGRAEVRLGGGVWGGAQAGASRVDAGPSATLGVPLGGAASARVAMDWRFRIAGDAAPRSGPAITLSAGF